MTPRKAKKERKRRDRGEGGLFQRGDGILWREEAINSRHLVVAASDMP
jgi:hypothetical protein